jgi:hypothetical protein
MRRGQHLTRNGWLSCRRRPSLLPKTRSNLDRAAWFLHLIPAGVSGNPDL